MSDDKKITDITIRRLEDKRDRAMDLADALTRVVADYATTTTPEDQLLGIELTARATVESLRSALGEEGLNEVIVEVTHRSKQYSLVWDRKHKGEISAVQAPHAERQKADVVPLRPRASEEGNDGNDQAPDR